MKKQRKEKGEMDECDVLDDSIGLRVVADDEVILIFLDRVGEMTSGAVPRRFPTRLHGFSVGRCLLSTRVRVTSHLSYSYSNRQRYVLLIPNKYEEVDEEVETQLFYRISFVYPYFGTFSFHRPC